MHYLVSSLRSDGSIGNLTKNISTPFYRIHHQMNSFTRENVLKQDSATSSTSWPLTQLSMATTHKLSTNAFECHMDLPSSEINSNNTHRAYNLSTNTFEGCNSSSSLPDAKEVPGAHDCKAGRAHEKIDRRF